MPHIKTLLLASVLALAVSGCGGVSGPAGGGSGGSTPADTTVPTVSITSPTSLSSFTTTSSTVSLSGSASDNVGVVSVTWRNLGNATTGSASGTGSWNIASITLVNGTNQITVTAQDAAGNTGAATLSLISNPGGPISLSGRVDSSLINRSSIGVNMVYLYSGAGVTPGEIGSGTPPLATAPVTQDNGACTFSYRFAGTLTDGQYTVAFVNQADASGVNDSITFRGTATVPVVSGTAIHDFAPNRRLQVGPTRTGANTFTVPSAAIAAAQVGDVIEIDAAEYLNDSAILTTSNLTLRGVGGARAHLRSTQLIGNDKGIWVNDAQSTTVENMEFSGAAVIDLNGAGIRNEHDGLTVCNGYFHDNENGILGGVGTVLIEYSEFNFNGDGSGQTHNMYIDGGTLFTLRYSYSHRAIVGHLVKSRAKETHILYNRIMDENDGAASYAIDIPDTGRTFIIGNLIQQGPLNQNSSVASYGAESANNPLHELYVVNNTFVNDNGQGSFFDIRAGTTALFVNNIFAGGGTVRTQAGITYTTNLASPALSQAAVPGITSVSSVSLVNSAGFDYHLASGSPAINAGSDPGTGASVSLTPTSQYVHPTNRQDRPINGTIDIGAYEF
jgi:hypothetical protein